MVEALLQKPLTLAMLNALQLRKHTLLEIAPTPLHRKRLQQLRQVNLVTAYQLGGIFYYCARRLPPYVAMAMQRNQSLAA